MKIGSICRNRLRNSLNTRMSTNTAWEVGQSQQTPLCDIWKQFDPNDPNSSFSQYNLIVSCVVPRPIALVSTVGAGGIRNCSPFSYFSKFI